MTFERGSGGKFKKSSEETVPPKQTVPQPSKPIPQKVLHEIKKEESKPGMEPMLPSDTVLTREVLGSDALSGYNERGAVIEGKIVPYGSFTVTFEGGRQITPSSKTEIVNVLVEQRKAQYREQGEGFIEQGYTPVQTEEGIRYVKQERQLLSPDYVPQPGDVQQYPSGPIVNIQPSDIRQDISQGIADMLGISRMETQEPYVVPGQSRQALYEAGIATPSVSQQEIATGMLSTLQLPFFMYGAGSLPKVAEAGSLVHKFIVGGSATAGVLFAGGAAKQIMQEPSPARQQFDIAMIAAGLFMGGKVSGLKLSDLSYTNLKGIGNRLNIFSEGQLEQPLIGERVPTTENIDVFISQEGRGLGIYEYPRKGSLDIFEIQKGQRSEIPSLYMQELTRLPGLDIIEAVPGKGLVIEDFLRPQTEGFIGGTTIKKIPSAGGGFIPGRNVPSLFESGTMPTTKAEYVGKLSPDFDVGKLGKNKPIEKWDEFLRELKETQKMEWIDVGKKETGLFSEITDVNLRGGIVRSDKVKVIPEEYFREPSKPSGVLDTVLSKKGRETLISSTEGELGKPMRKVDVFDVIKGKENVETILGERRGTGEQKYFWEDRVISKEKPSLLTQDEISRLTDLIIERNKPIPELVKATGKREVTLFDRLKTDEGFRVSGTYESPELYVRSPYERLNIRELIASEKGVSGGSEYWSGVKPSGVERPAIGLSDFIVSRKPGQLGGIKMLPVSGEIAATITGRHTGELKLSATGLVSGQQLGELQLQGLERLQTTAIQQELAQQQNQARISIQDVASIQEQGLEQNQRQRQKQQQIQGLQTLQMQESIYDSIHETMMDAELIVDVFIPSFTITEKPIEPTEEITKIIPGVPELEEEGIGFGGDQAYVVKVRGKQYSHGRKVGDDSFHRASGPLSFDDAMSKAVDIVGGSEKAAFMLEAVKEKPGKGSKLPSWTNEIYKYNQKDKDTWVEQPPFRIDSSGEIRAITMKGIEARRRF